MSALNARIELRLRQARETIEALQRLRESDGSREAVVALHKLHARHERELGHDASARRAEGRARRAMGRFPK